ncbi:lysozyme inhibitor LprI family protein [Aeromonas caviae]|nr:lysozyme inhibitor LprI family protein [Aeromonas caviae]MEB6651260.1 lysozyme inhibitor LprI family protein [Aeromonas caviae]
MTKMLFGTLALMPLLASAATPSFDCTKAHSAAEQLVCQDAGLAALDNELAALYPKAIANFSPEQAKEEKAIQRGWIKGRNECWKESNSRQCVEESYQTRITELQIKGGQLRVPSPVEYLCDGELRLSTYFYNEARRPAAVINLNEGAQQSQVLAFETPSASGAR